MIAICEECSKKYNVDESKIKSDRARFACFECGHMIIVEKPATAAAGRQRAAAAAPRTEE